MLQTLDVVIGFLSIILLLSVLVTAASHFTQAALRMRGRVLRRGLATLIDTVTDRGPTKSKADAFRICDVTDPSPKRRGAVPGTKNEASGGKRAGIVRRAIGPRRSWMGLADVAAAIHELRASTVIRGPKAVKAEARAAEREARKLFPAVAGEMNRRFAFRMRVVAVFWAAAVAFYYQVSAPDLFARLSGSPEAASAGVTLAREALRDSGTGGAVEKNALETRPATRPDPGERPRKPEGSAVGGPSEGEEPLKGGSDVAGKEARPKAGASEAGLSRVDLRSWPGGWRFYWHDGPKVENLIGVLMTVILLSLGAPFWFEALKGLVGLRDRLKPAPKKSEAEDPEEPEPPGEEEGGGDGSEKKKKVSPGKRRKRKKAKGGGTSGGG